MVAHLGLLRGGKKIQTAARLLPGTVKKVYNKTYFFHPCHRLTYYNIIPLIVSACQSALYAYRASLYDLIILREAYIKSKMLYKYF